MRWLPSQILLFIDLREYTEITIADKLLSVVSYKAVSSISRRKLLVDVARVAINLIFCSSPVLVNADITAFSDSVVRLFGVRAARHCARQIIVIIVGNSDQFIVN